MDFFSTEAIVALLTLTSLEVVSRAILVLAIGFVMPLNQPWFSVFGIGFSGKDIILVLGGPTLMRSKSPVHG